MYRLARANFPRIHQISSSISAGAIAAPLDWPADGVFPSIRQMRQRFNTDDCLVLRRSIPFSLTLPSSMEACESSLEGAATGLTLFKPFR